jgi:hypothetical protein
MVGLQTLDLAIGVRVPASQPTVSRQTVNDWAIARSSFSNVVCLKLLRFRYPVSQYFSAVRNHEDPALPQPSDAFLAMTRRSYTVLSTSLRGGSMIY